MTQDPIVETAGSSLEWQNDGVDYRVRVTRRVLDGVHREGMTGFRGNPLHTIESGGLLLGRILPRERVIEVEDFEPVPCRHSIDAGFHLSEEDRAAFEETIEFFRSGGQPGLNIVGIYRSHARFGLFVSEEDERLLRDYFKQDVVAVLIDKPLRAEESTIDFFVWNRGLVEKMGQPLRMPDAKPQRDRRTAFRTISPVAPAERVSAGPNSEVREAPQISTPIAARPEKPSLPLVDTTPKPIVERDLTEKSDPVKAGNFFSRLRFPKVRLSGTHQLVGRPTGMWIGLAMVTLAALALAAVELRGHIPSARVPPPQDAFGAPAPDPATQVQPATNASPTTPASVRSRPQATSTVLKNENQEAQILDDIRVWADRLKQGDLNGFVNCYAPTLGRYFTKTNVNRAEVANSAAQMRARFGEVTRLDLSNIQVIQRDADHATVFLRKAWETAGPRQFAGSEDERMEMIRYDRGWKIESELETKLYWVRRE